MSGYLVDTNVVSELTKRPPHASVLAFLESTTQSQLFLSAISWGELERGIERLPDGSKRAGLRQWLTATVKPFYTGRLLAVDGDVMSSWAYMLVALGRTPGQVPALDALIAATAFHHNLTVVTRNTADFSLFGVPLLNPFQDDAP